jgi:hypothetical protein
MAPMNASASGAHSDIEGVGNLKVGSLLGVIVQAMFWAGFLIFDLIFNALSNRVTTFGTNGGSIPGWISLNTFYLAVAMLAGGLVLGIVGFVFFYLGFRAVKRGAPDFGAPTTLMIIGLIGYLMLALGIVVIISAFVNAINSATTAAVSSGSVGFDIGAILSGLALIGIGAILALIGVIGLVLGNWRAGTRYGESTLKIGAILSILPYVSIAGYVLLLVGYMKAGTKLQSGWAPPGMGMGGPVAYAAQPWQSPPPPPPPPR